MTTNPRSIPRLTRQGMLTSANAIPPRFRHLGSKTFAAQPDQAGAARRWLVALLAAAEPADSGGVRDDCMLLLSETMTNAMRHSDGDKIEIFVHEDHGAVRIEVVDGGGATLPRRTDDPCGEHGRGIPIVSALARTWGYEAMPDGRLRVWFEVAADGG